MRADAPLTFLLYCAIKGGFTDSPSQMDGSVSGTGSLSDAEEGCPITCSTPKEIEYGNVGYKKESPSSTLNKETGRLI